MHRVLGIVNGTTNFILDLMDSSGAGFEDALEEAQALGYAEADPTADVEGFDAAAKAAILAGLAFHPRDRRRRLPRGHHRPDRGTCVAAPLGASSSCWRSASRPGPAGQASAVRVHPAMIPRRTRSPAARRVQRGVRRGSSRPAS